MGFLALFGFNGGFGLVGVGLGPGEVGFFPGVLTFWLLEVTELLLPGFLAMPGIEGGG